MCLLRLSARIAWVLSYWLHLPDCVRAIKLHNWRAGKRSSQAFYLLGLSQFMCLLHVLPKIEGKEVHCIIGQEARPGAEESKAALYSLLLPLSAICLLHVLPKIACMNSMNTCNGLVLWVHITHLVDWRWRHCMQDRIWGRNICQNFHLFSFMHECLRRGNTEMAWKFFLWNI